MDVIDRKIDELKPASYNPREMSVEEANDLEQSLREFGAVDPAIVNIHPKRKNIIVGGHQRIRIAKERLGWETYPCVEVKLTKKKERELNIRLNKNQGHWDWDKLANEFDIPELTDWGFTEKELFVFDESEFGDKFMLPDGEKSNLEQITFTLSHKQARRVRVALEAVNKTRDFDPKTTGGNENKNGNALHWIVDEYLKSRKIEVEKDAEPTK